MPISSVKPIENRQYGPPNADILEIHPHLPLNKFLDYGDFKTSVRWKASFDGGLSGGTGQQNPSFVFDYGISDDSLFSIYVTGADDDLYKLPKNLIQFRAQIAGALKAEVTSCNPDNFLVGERSSWILSSTGVSKFLFISKCFS